MRTIEEIIIRLLGIKTIVDEGIYLYEEDQGNNTKKLKRTRTKAIKNMLKDKRILENISYRENILYNQKYKAEGLYSRIKSMASIEEHALPILYILEIQNELLDADQPFRDGVYYQQINFGEKDSVNKSIKQYLSVDLHKKVDDLIKYHNDLSIINWRVKEKMYGYKKEIDIQKTLKDTKLDVSNIFIKNNDIYFTHLKKPAHRLTYKELYDLESITSSRIETIEWLLFDKNLDEQVTVYKDLNIIKIHTQNGIVESQSALLKK